MRDTGMTLVELLVAMTISTVLLAAAVGVFIGTLKTQKFVNTRTNTTIDARVAMERMTRELRTATSPRALPAAVAEANVSSVTFYALINRGSVSNSAYDSLNPTKVEYYFNNGCVYGRYTPMSSTTTTWMYQTSQAETICILRTSVAPKFRYYTFTSIDMDPISQVVPPLDAQALSRILSIEVDLHAQDSSGPSNDPGTAINSRVSLTNLVEAAGRDYTRTWSINSVPSTGSTPSSGQSGSSTTTIINN